VLPPPKGYLERLRAICDKHGILLIFDEVITGYGRLGYAFAAERYGVVPDMITFAKGITSGAVPMGGVVVRKGIYDAFMKGPEHVIELFHGYTYSLDIRPVGLTVGIDLASKPDGVGKRGMDALDLGFFEHDVMFRAVGDTLALSPPLIVSESQIGEIFDKLARIIKAVA
jgi:beta-alanine--pyruvate transaminase